MRTHLIFFLCILVGIQFSALAQDPAHVQWAESFDKGKEMARKEGKPLVVFFTFDTCYWCRELEKKTFIDAQVIKASNQLVWVEVNRDHTPALPERFHVQAYPAILILGDAEENVHRFSGFKLPAEFLKELEEGLRRFDLYRSGKEWSEPAPRPSVLTEAARITTYRAPLREIGCGLACIDDRLFVAQGNRLYELKGPDREAFECLELPELVNGLTSDGKSIYAVTYGWSHGDPIYVIDPDERRIVRSIVTDENKANPESSTFGITWRDGSLYVLARGAKIHQVNPESGAIEKCISTATNRLFGLAFDGSHFVAADEHGLVFLDHAGQIAGTLSTNYRLRIVAARNDHIFVMEQPVFGFDKHHQDMMVWPKEMLIYELQGLEIAPSR